MGCCGRRRRRVSRLERASVVMDPGAQQVHVNEKKHVPFARRLTRIVADSKLNLEECARPPFRRPTSDERLR